MTLRPLGCWVGLVLSLVGPSDALAQAQPTNNASETGEGPASEEYTREVKLAVEAYNKDDFATARQHFARAHELRPSARTWRGLGTTAFELKFYDDAVRELSFALEDRRSALTDKLRSETELTLRVAQRRLRESQGEREVATAEPSPSQPSAAEPMPAAPPAALQASDAEAGGSLGTQRVAAIAVGALGVVSVGIGVGFGLKSIAKGNARDRLCPEKGGECSPEGAKAADDAITAGNISTVAWAIGGVAIAGGVVLWLTGGTSEKDSASAKVEVGVSGLRVRGAF